MNLYEHTIIARKDTSPSELKQLSEKYSKIIKKNKKGSYIHFKIKGNGNIINELEKNESIDKKLLRYLTVKVKRFDLETNYFSKKEDIEKKEITKN